MEIEVQGLMVKVGRPKHEVFLRHSLSKEKEKRIMGLQNKNGSGKMTRRV